MQIPFINLHAQYKAYQAEIQQAINEVLDSGQYIMGPQVAQLEKNLADYTGCPHVIACSSGSDAQLLALMALDIQPGDEVITTPFTFVATGSMIALLGAVPVFADIDPDTFLIDPKKIAEKITKKTKAIIPVSIFGQVADMDEINTIAGDNIIVIEDAAQSFGAEYKGKKSCHLSKLAFTSFFPSKPLGCYGDGGAIFTQDKVLADKLYSLRAHGQTKRYHHQYIGINGRLDTLQAAILNIKLKYFANEMQKRHQIGQHYTEKIKNIQGITGPVIKRDRTSAFAQYSILSQNRELLIKKLESKNIPIAIHYPKPLHLQECFEYLNYQAGDFPVAEEICQQVLSLPMSAFLTKLEQDYILNALS